eukprot:jgi/Mesvir1/10038/Mv08622-RA.1
MWTPSARPSAPPCSARRATATWRWSSTCLHTVPMWMQGHSGAVRTGGRRFTTRHGHLSVVEQLISSKADVDAVAGDKSTPLHLAAAAGHLNVVHCLLSKGAKLEARNERGRTPLAMAAAEGRLEVVKYLLSLQADVNTKDVDGETPAASAERGLHVDAAILLNRRAKMKAEQAAAAQANGGPVRVALCSG